MQGKTNANVQAKTKVRGVTLLALTAVLGAAVYLNWNFSQAGPTAAADAADTPVAVSLDGGAADAASDAADAAPGTAAEVFDPLADQAESTAAAPAESEASSAEAGKNYGEAQLVSVSKDSGSEFFESARLTRAKTRDEALDTIKKTLRNTGLSQDEKDKLTEELNARVSAITVESDLETQIKSKGFADCVVLLDADKANVTVMTENDALTAGEVTRIRDILLNQCRGLSAQDITVVEVK